MKKGILMAVFALPLTVSAVQFKSSSGNILCNSDTLAVGSVSCFVMNSTLPSHRLPNPNIAHWIGGRFLVWAKQARRI